MERPHIIEPGELTEFRFPPWYLRHGVHGVGSLGHPDALQLTFFQEHTHLIGLRVVHANVGAILVVDGKVDGLYVALGIALIDFTVVEPGEHLLRRHLVVVFLLVEFLHGEGLPDDMGMLNGGILHEDHNLLAQQLPVLVPGDGVFIHGHRGVLRVID